MSTHETLRLRLEEVDRGLTDAYRAATEALTLAGDERWPCWAGCRSLTMRLDEAWSALARVKSHLEESTHA